MGDVGLYSEVMEAGAVSHSSLARPGDLLEQSSFRWGHQPPLHYLLSGHRLISVSLGLTLIRTVASLTAATSGVCRVTTTRRNIHSHVSINWVILSGVGKLYCQRRIMDINDDNNFPNMLSLG